MSEWALPTIKGINVIAQAPIIPFDRRQKKCIKIDMPLPAEAEVSILVIFFDANQKPIAAVDSDAQGWEGNGVFHRLTMPAKESGGHNFEFGGDAAATAPTGAKFLACGWDYTLADRVLQ